MIRPLLRFDGTAKDFGQLRAVGPVRLDVHSGQLVALVGHNGSGKSTLLATAAGVLTPTEGQVLIEGEPAGSRRARAAVSYVRDQPVLYDDIGLREQIDYLARLHGTTPAMHDVDRIFDRFALTDRADDLPGTFSRGLRQKAAITVALCRPFAVLLVDEPFAGLDAAGQSVLVELLDEIRAENGAVIVATHDRAKLTCFDRCVELCDGEIISDGPAA